MTTKKRLDQFIQEQQPTFSKTQIQSWIMQGKIQVDGTIITKPGTLISPQAIIHYNIEQPKYVSRAGFKLEKALDYFTIDVTDLIAMDAGISTGGFTDCLLQHGAQKVYGIDVGYGQVHEKIRNDPRVILKERTNLRLLTNFPEVVDIVTLDLSFISVLKVMDAINGILKPGGILIVLIKPQFEARKDQVGAGGIIKDEAIHAQVVERVKKGIEEYGYTCHGIIDSPITGTMGNKEFLAYFIRN